MSSSFNMSHYTMILNLIKSKHYDPRFIGDDTEGSKVMFLRHDIDISLDAAEVMAESERKAGIYSTFYFMTKSNFYNLFSPEAERVISNVAGMGHKLGLHLIEPSNFSDIEANTLIEFALVDHFHKGAFSRTVSFHNPSEKAFGLKLECAVNAYEDTYFKSIKYLSDSNQEWREGDFYEIVRSGQYNKLQVLTHPVFWVFGKGSLKETVRNLFAIEHIRRKELLAEERAACRKRI